MTTNQQAIIIFITSTLKELDMDKSKHVNITAIERRTGLKLASTTVFHPDFIEQKKTFLMEEVANNFQLRADQISLSTDKPMDLAA